MVCGCPLIRTVCCSPCTVASTKPLVVVVPLASSTVSVGAGTGLPSEKLLAELVTLLGWIRYSSPDTVVSVWPSENSMVTVVPINSSPEIAPALPALLKPSMLVGSMSMAKLMDSPGSKSSKETLSTE